MNGGRYRIDMAITNRLPGPTDEPTARRLVERLAIYLPEGGSAAEIRTDPDTKGVEFIATLTAPSPGDALNILRAAMEYLRENVRREHGLPPIGPEAVLRQVILTCASAEEDEDGESV